MDDSPASQAEYYDCRDASKTWTPLFTPHNPRITWRGRDRNPAPEEAFVDDRTVQKRVVWLDDKNHHTLEMRVRALEVQMKGLLPAHESIHRNSKKLPQDDAEPEDLMLKENNAITSNRTASPATGDISGDDSPKKKENEGSAGRKSWLVDAEEASPEKQSPKKALRGTKTQMVTRGSLAPKEKGRKAKPKKPEELQCIASVSSISNEVPIVTKFGRLVIQRRPHYT